MRDLKTITEITHEINLGFAKLERAIRTGEAKPELINLSVRLEGQTAVMWRMLIRIFTGLCHQDKPVEAIKKILEAGIRSVFNQIFAETFQKFLNKGEQ